MLHFYQIPDAVKNAKTLKRLGYNTEFLMDEIHVLKENKEGCIVNERFHAIGEFMVFSNLIIQLATSVNPDDEDSLLFNDLLALRKNQIEREAK
jgi:hypothetical protein